jgi:hypothetical protein
MDYSLLSNIRQHNEMDVAWFPPRNYIKYLYKK